jgi:hypothetical protein
MSLTVGINTYVTVPEANAYFASRLYSDQWTGASGSDKETALTMARRVLERQAWKGSRADADQMLAWPRDGVVDREGSAISSTLVPQDIMDAQCELALANLADDLTGNDDTRGIRRLKAGTVEVEYDGRAPARALLPDIVLDLLRPYLAQETAGLSIAVQL